MTKPTDVTTFIGDLNAGIVEETVSKILSEAAMSTVNHSKASKVSLTFDIKRIAQSHQVQVAAELKFKMPTDTGSVSEDSTTTTPFHVNAGGRMTLFPENQTDMFSTAQEKARAE